MGGELLQNVFSQVGSMFGLTVFNKLNPYYLFTMQPYTDSINSFINSTVWTYAKTMPDWPHEYIVRSRVDENQFVEMVKHIRKFGYQGSFYHKAIIYFEQDDLIYWTMGEPLELTTIINRCKKENSYEARLKNGTLPEAKTRYVKPEIHKQES
jgi:hypothetical protein